MQHPKYPKTPKPAFGSIKVFSKDDKISSRSTPRLSKTDLTPNPSPPPPLVWPLRRKQSACILPDSPPGTPSRSGGVAIFFEILCLDKNVCEMIDFYMSILSTPFRVQTGPGGVREKD